MLKLITEANEDDIRFRFVIIANHIGNIIWSSDWIDNINNTESMEHITTQANTAVTILIKNIKEIRGLLCK
jgi:hypothetical protein